MKQQIYNLIILDESGSMGGTVYQTISGCNETIQTIKAAQQKYSDSQEHFVSIYVFQSGGRQSRYIIKNAEAATVEEIKGDDYTPNGSTPLNDAVGSTLSDLRATIGDNENAVGSVTIITDGMENASREYTTRQVGEMIAMLKERGWSFNFIGANIDVVGTAAQYNIDNALTFSQEDEGTREMFERENMHRMSYYDRVNNLMEFCGTYEERREAMRESARGYFEPAGLYNPERTTPDFVTSLAPNEVFVFGSDLGGLHGGGAAMIAVTHFGAIRGIAEGIQGQSYAIPTVQGKLRNIEACINRFIDYAKANPDMKFLVTRIGCGAAGYNDSDIAPLFRDAVSVENICLPRSFWRVLNR